MLKNKKKILDNFKLFLNSTVYSSNYRSKQRLVSFCEFIDEIAFTNLLNYLQEQKITFLYWGIENENREFLGFDPLINITASGNNRILQTRSKIEEIKKDFVSNWTSDKNCDIPLVLGGIKFAPNQKSEVWEDFFDSDWFIPKLLLSKNNSRNYLIYNSLINHHDIYSELEQFSNILDQLIHAKSVVQNKNKDWDIINVSANDSYSEWEKNVNLAVEKISNKNLSKVVLSREVKFKLTKKPILPTLLNELSSKYPRCYTFAYQKQNSCFWGASPEKLARFSEEWIEVDALAGSAPRGNSKEEDDFFEHFLLNSKKNLNEQQAVVNFIQNLLAQMTEEITFNEKPIIRKLSNIQHLWTTIKAKLKKEFSLFDILKELHPTPAICGTPWLAARNTILEMEKHDRGMYTGNIGWFNFNGNGEFAVGIRSALLKSDYLYAYSGCGIVEGSEPKMEFEESEIKLKPILSLFVDEKIYQS